MPYLKTEQKQALNPRTDREIASAGELNFCVTRLVDQFLGAAPAYQDFNDAMGALEGAKLELYRRVVGPYEDEKAKINGEVYRVRD